MTPYSSLTKTLSTHLLLATLLLLTGSVGLRAQTSSAGNAVPLRSSKSFQSNETLNYSLYFKWGIIKGKGGEANVLIRTGEPGSSYPFYHQLRFKTTGIFDKVYTVRDTMETLYNANGYPLRWEKRANEGGYFLIDELTFSYPGDRTRIDCKQYTPTEVRRDTVKYSDSRGPVLDMLSTLSILRTLPKSGPGLGWGRSFQVATARDLINIEMVYAGREVLQMPDGTDIETIKIDFNVFDKTFSTSSRSVEAWVTNDERQIPLRLKAKLKIGYAEAELTSYTPR